MTSDKIHVRPRPCASCPYRRDVPSGVWAASEYEKLRGYDGTIDEQVMAGAFGVFHCHQGNNEVCAGWAGCHDMDENLAIRLHGSLVDPAVFDYMSPVPLFSSGNEAADHGERDIENPTPKAKKAMEKIARVRAVRGQPVQYEIGRAHV